VRRSIQCVYPTERRFRGPGRKKNPPHILNPDGSLVGSFSPSSASPLPLEIGPDGQPIIPPPQPKKKKLTKKARLAQEAEEAAARESELISHGAEQSELGHLDHQIHEHLMQQHHQQQIEHHLSGGGGGGEVSTSDADALMIAEALVGAAALGGMSGGMSIDQEHEVQETQHPDQAGDLPDMSGHQEGAAVQEYPPPIGAAESLQQQEHEPEGPVQDDIIKTEVGPDTV
jgi:hypothetical protein